MQLYVLFVQDIPTGPAVTVFVGNITERAPDAMVRHLLTTCGPVLSWKRVQGATGKLQVPMQNSTRTELNYF